MAGKKTSTGLDENVEGALAYLLGPITGILFLILEKDNKFVRFHAMQSTILFGGLWILSFITAFVPFLGTLLTVIGVVLWILLMVKAYQGEKYELPVIGEIASKHV